MNPNQDEFDFSANGDESGYHQWQKESTSAPTPPPQPATSPELDFAGPADESGYQQWQAELASARNALERRWGIRLGCKVRVELSTLTKPIVGPITQSPNDTKNLKTNKEPLLKIGTFEFYPSEITSLVVVVDTPT